MLWSVGIYISRVRTECEVTYELRRTSVSTNRCPDMYSVGNVVGFVVSKGTESSYADDLQAAVSFTGTFVP